MTSKPPRPPSLSNYRPSDDRPGADPNQPPHPRGNPRGYHQAKAQNQAAGAHDPRYQGQPPGRPMSNAAHNHGGGGGGSRPPRRKGFGIGSFLLYSLVAIIAIIAAGLTFLIISPPTDFIRSQAIAAVKKNTGRDLIIKGPTSISFYPSIGVSMADVSLSSPPGMGGPPMAKIADLTVAVKLLPLLSREVVVDSLILTRPEFDLRVDAKGRKSWDFAHTNPAHTPAKRVRFAQLRQAQATTNDSIPAEAREFLENATDGSATSKSKKINIAALEQLRLGDVRIVDGKIRYTDVPAKVSQRVDALNVSVDLRSIGAPLNAKGNLNWKGEKINFDTTLASIKLILQEEPAKLETKISSRRVTAAYDGILETANGLVLDGALNADAKSMRLLAGWLGTKLPKVEGFGPLSIQGRLKANGNAYSIVNAKIGIDGATATGKATLKTGGMRPHINATLKLSELNLNKYMSAPGKAARKGGASGGANPSNRAPAPTSGAAPSSRQPAPKPKSPQVRGFTKRAGWSREIIDLSSLGAVDANADLTVGRLLYQDIKVDRTRLKVKLKDAVMRADLTEMKLYKGSGRGIVTLNAKSAKAADVNANFAVNNVAVQKLLTDAADIDWLTGTGNLTLAVTTRGRNQHQFVNALNGTSTINFNDGAIVGFNLPQLIRSVSRGQFAGLDRSSTQKTDFSELKATFNIKRGIASNTDLSMASPLLRVTGAGKIFLPKQTVDYTVKPKLVSELKGQGGGQGLSGIVVPVRIHGPFANLKYTPDIGGILEDPEAAAGAIKQIGEKFKQFKGKKPSEILDGILGGANGGEGGNGGKVDTKKLLEGLFGN